MEISCEMLKRRPVPVLLVTAILVPGISGAPATAGVLSDYSTKYTGFSTETDLTLDSMSVVSGGIERGTRGRVQIDMVGEISTAEKNWWKGGTFSVHLLGLDGGHVGALAGDDQGINNMDGDTTFRIFQLWYQHEWEFARSSLLFGLHDFNSEFQVLNHAGVLVNSSFGISREVSQAGPSIYPVTSLGLRFQFRPVAGAYVRAAAYDGVPGDPDDHHGTQITVKSSDGVFYVAEAGLEPDLEAGKPGYYKLGLGVWNRTTDFDDFSGIARDANSGAYFLMERTFAGNIGAFFRVGKANADRNQIGEFFAAGVTFAGMLKQDAGDVLGFGVVQARNSDDYIAANPDIQRAETVVELAYDYPLTDSVSLHPDVQYVIHPGMDAALDDALVLGLRVKIGL
jgi:porin